ncbi:integral membrane sensor hybrid histidine kinase [Tolypothrix tenuis PCC 7101]|uniref:Circadian input-output histidine kinase CikA n=2 Tax=Tolypothrix TaxID=111782 RepID=A0A1Z4N6R6_9CYAN|nr:response regulator [Aulosira sp. FACHB-113]BAZ01406.1 integral membrane sensor hybrid histidine kinase [Tolypothrix tenuis PCC 7101]BAZ74671.1 integral membrane sensor hybrid histidine kinase [Aulosira laxa NIES-50]
MMLTLLKDFYLIGFIPHGHCYLWQTGLVWLNIIGDATIALAYYSIPCLLVYFISRRKDVPFNGVFLLFGAFIIACGTGHLMDIWTLWYPDYWIAAGLKAFTALISIYTAFALVYLIPLALKIPSPAQLEAANQALKSEIVERKRIEQELRIAEEIATNSSQAKSEFLANMSHELRTPLNGILGYTQILQRTESLTEKGYKGVEIIQQCGSHLLTLINDVLDLAKIEARKLELNPIDFYFPAFIDSVTEICRIRAEQKVIGFHVQLSADLPVGIRADDKRLRQVLINLLGNAIKFTEKGSVIFKVEVKATQEEFQQLPIHKIRFEVTDTGVGMNPEQLQKIFLPFEQVGEQKLQFEGTGLGLAITHKFITLMGSQIEVKSELGQGSSFWFDLELPEAKDWAKASRAIRQGTVVGYEGKKRTILVVDDKWQNRSVVINLLEPIGFVVIEASNGKEALAQVSAYQPDLVITDLMMPVMNGFEFITQLRQFSQFEKTTVIASSASVFETDQYKSIDAGANAFLPKPIDAEMLLELLRKYLLLEWVYDNTSNDKITSIKGITDNQEDIIPPNQEVLHKLLELVRDGDIEGIIEIANQISILDEKINKFAQQITHFASNFQVKLLEEFVQKYLPLT